MTFEQKMIRSLVKYDKDQLIELFHDMVDLEGGKLPFRARTFEIVMLDQVVEHLL